MSSCEAIVMCDYKFLTKMYKYLSKLFAKSVQRTHKPYRLPDVCILSFSKRKRGTFCFFIDNINFISRLYNLRL